ncbi:bifunctional protein-serine/threonine kinase/phosphatase [Quatrionicoccus australiensis]|uniref:bifunctional protein-serine/threonine kinase/phosphatase n=1 Tax=Quatrionicoccus australiensis TaxID=138118 RepID=UPI001CF8346D|nr:bifunctional protein-serine/threonine kinase/phosphatase [Quatrionicoccus australiensis]UCV16071.1 protein kinase [Quatrionicoccus australiensis]
MRKLLRVTIGQHSLAGAHTQNQDFHGALLPSGYLCSSKGIVLALADGISSSEVSHLASATAVRSFLDDYYASADAWTVRRSAQCVLGATNAWLHGQTMRSAGRFDKDRGYVCTFSALVIKGRQLHLLHVGDSRIFRLHPQALEQLSEDHRIRFGAAESYLARALGTGPHVEIDYRSWEATVGEVYILATDGAYEYLDAAQIHRALVAHGDNLDAAAEELVALARANGSEDDATLQMLRIDDLPEDDTPQAQLRREDRLLPPILAPRNSFEGFSVVRELQITSRSHLHLAIDEASGQQVVLKTPSVDLREDPDYLDGFVLEEWVARRVDSPNVVKAWVGDRPRTHLYVALEYIEGQTLAQWMTDNPNPSLDAVRAIVQQIANGLQALHRREMVHRDLRPENVMIDRHGTVKLIDLASVQVAGLIEGSGGHASALPAGTLQYLAPECLLGDAATPQSDLFALAVLTYRMLSGHLPYGLDAARVRQIQDLRRLRYVSLRHHRPELPAWLDGVLAKALHVTAARRQEAVSELVFDLESPGAQFCRTRRQPLLERDPVLFWKCLSALLGLALIVSLLLRSRGF